MNKTSALSDKKVKKTKIREDLSGEIPEHKNKSFHELPKDLECSYRED